MQLSISIDTAQTMRHEYSQEAAFYYHARTFPLMGPFPAVVPAVRNKWADMSIARDQGNKDEYVSALLNLSDMRSALQLGGRRGSFDMRVALGCHTGGNVVVRRATYEEHREASIAGVAEHSGRDVVATTTLNTLMAIADGTMSSNCSTIRFWKNRVVPLHYWVEPFTCNTSRTNFFVRLPTMPCNQYFCVVWPPRDVA